MLSSSWEWAPFLGLLVFVEGREDEMELLDEDDVEADDTPTSPRTPFVKVLIKSILESVARAYRLEENGKLKWTHRPF